MKLILAALGALTLLGSGCVVRTGPPVAVGGTVGVGVYEEPHYVYGRSYYPHRYYERGYHAPYDRDRYFYRY